MMNAITISVTTLGRLNLPDPCLRCLWIRLRCGDKFPFQMMPGIFRSIHTYCTNLIHNFFDQNAVLPPWLPDLGKVKGYIPGEKLNWSRFSFDDPATGITLRGQPDDIFQLTDNSYHIVDYKTAKVTGKQDELFAAYDAQLNAYAYIAEREGFSPVSGVSLIYLEPQTDVSPHKITDLMSEGGLSMNFKATRKPVELRADKLIPELLQRARELFDTDSPPKGKAGCEDCKLLDQLLTVAQPQAPSSLLDALKEGVNKPQEK